MSKRQETRTRIAVRTYTLDCDGQTMPALSRAQAVHYAKAASRQAPALVLRTDHQEWMRFERGSIVRYECADFTGDAAASPED